MRLIRLSETMHKTGLSRTRLYEAMGRGEFPKPVKLTDDGRAIAWPEDEIEAWVQSRIAARDTDR
jgi:prophage regulatory protein